MGAGDCQKHWFRGEDGSCEPCSDLCREALTAFAVQINCKRHCQEYWHFLATTTSATTTSGAEIHLTSDIGDGVVQEHVGNRIVTFTVVACVIVLVATAFLLLVRKFWKPKKQNSHGSHNLTITENQGTLINNRPAHVRSNDDTIALEIFLSNSNFGSENTITSRSSDRTHMEVETTVPCTNADDSSAYNITTNQLESSSTDNSNSSIDISDSNQSLLSHDSLDLREDEEPNDIHNSDDGSIDTESESDTMIPDAFPDEFEPASFADEEPFMNPQTDEPVSIGQLGINIRSSVCSLTFPQKTKTYTQLPGDERDMNLQDHPS